VLAVIALVLVLYVAVSTFLRIRRRNVLIARYGSADIAHRIIAGKVWQGMTRDQLRDAWGEPEDRDEQVLKTKTKEVWKYGRTSRTRFAQKVFIEDEVVTGWESR
jgi:hypothetical protein